MDLVAQWPYLGTGFFPSLSLILIWRLIGNLRRGESDDALRTAEVIGLCHAMPILSSFGIPFCMSNLSVYDGMLMAADSMLGTQISFVVSKWMTANGAIRLYGYMAYYYLAFFMQMALLIVYKHSRDNSRAKTQPYVIPAFLFVITTLLGLYTYTYLPAVGTAVYCGSQLYPNGPIPVVNTIPHTVEAPPTFPRNCMPSLHLTWILCSFFAVCNLKKIYKYVGAAIVISVLLSAFSVGNHWISDFVGSLPFTAFCLSLTSTKAPTKWRLWSTFYCGPCFCAFVYMIKHHIVWIMGHQALYLGLIALMDVSAWIICCKLLPPECEELQGAEPAPNEQKCAEAGKV